MIIIVADERRQCAAPNAQTLRACTVDDLAIAGDDPRDERVVLGLRYRRVARQRAEIVVPLEPAPVGGAPARGRVVVEHGPEIRSEPVPPHAGSPHPRGYRPDAGP